MSDDLGGEAPCFAHLLDDQMPDGALSGGARGVVLDPATVGPGAGDGVAWSLPDGGDLNANLVQLQPAGTIGEHVNHEVDVAIAVVAGAGQIVLDGTPRDLAPGVFALAPRGLRRAVVAGEGGLTYFSIHRRRGPLAIATKPAGRR